MRPQVVFRYLGVALLLNGAFMCLAAGVSLVTGDRAFMALLYGGLVTLLFGAFPLVFVPRTEDLSSKEGVSVVVGAWLMSCVFGMIPYLLWGGPFSLTNAWFESVSGYTTTGASILTDIEALPPGLLFWRAATHWLGGIGIILFVLAVLPFLGLAEMVLFRSEVSPIVLDSFRKQSRHAVRILWGVYCSLTLLETAALMLCGLGLFDAVTHAFATIATGGFSVRNASIAHFDSLAVEVVVSVFMVVSGLHFGLLYGAVTGRWRDLYHSTVVRYYLGSMAVAALVVTALLHGPLGWAQALRQAVFQVVTLGTSTGFATADSSVWPPLAQLLLVVMTLQCACSGSTSGGIKVDRVVIFGKALWIRIQRLMHPNAAISLKLDGRALVEVAVGRVLLFILTYMGVVLVSTALLAAMDVDLITAFSGSAACMGGVGPGLGAVGSMANYGHLPPAAKWVLSVTMLTGRVEIYTLFLFLAPGHWRRATSY
ncbi:MAG: TrkH family potassium uptake protein [Gemmatimonadota bacterium]